MATILIVDDNELNIIIISQILRNQGFSIISALSGESALQCTRETMPDLILLDVMMPGMNGFETCKHLKSDPATQDVPLIFLSALDDTEAKVRAFEVGGVDYITKPFQEQEIIARVKLHIRLSSLEKERLTHIKALEELNEEKDKMMQIVSHDLRSPLGGVKGLAEILRDGDEAFEPHKVKEFGGMIYSSVETLIGLINDLLDIAKIESGVMSLNYSDFEIREVTLRCIEAIQLLAFRKGVVIEMDAGEEEMYIQADRPKVMQVINNLLSNAVKFTDYGGKIKVEIRKENPNVRIEISDTGLGMPEEMLPRLFDKFGSHQRSGTAGEKGSGLGMPIVKRFVELHNGTITVHSSVGKGTTFTILLPVQPLQKD